MLFSVAHDPITLAQLTSLLNIVFLSSSTVTHFLHGGTLSLFPRVVLAYSVISIEFKSADENGPKFSIKFCALSIKGELTYFKRGIFVCLFLARMKSFS